MQTVGTIQNLDTVSAFEFQNQEAALISALHEINNLPFSEIFSSGTLAFFLLELNLIEQKCFEFFDEFGDYNFAPCTLEEFALMYYHFRYAKSNHIHINVAQATRRRIQRDCILKDPLDLKTFLFSHYVGHENGQHLSFSVCSAKHYYNRSKPSRTDRVNLCRLLILNGVSKETSYHISLCMPTSHLEDLSINLGVSRKIRIERLVTYMGGLMADPVIEFSSMSNQTILIGVQHGFPSFYGRTSSTNYVNYESKNIFNHYLHWGHGECNYKTIFPPRYDENLGRGNGHLIKPESTSNDSKNIILCLNEEELTNDNLLLESINKVFVSNNTNICLTICAHPGSSISQQKRYKELVKVFPSQISFQIGTPIELAINSQFVILASPTSSMIGMLLSSNIPFTAISNNLLDLKSSARTLYALEFVKKMIAANIFIVESRLSEFLIPQFFQSDLFLNIKETISFLNNDMLSKPRLNDYLMNHLNH